LEKLQNVSTAVSSSAVKAFVKREEVRYTQ